MWNTEEDHSVSGPPNSCSPHSYTVHSTHGVRYFHNVIFPWATSKRQFPKLQFSKSEISQAASSQRLGYAFCIGGRVLRLEQARGPSVAARTDMRSCRL